MNLHLNRQEKKYEKKEIERNFCKVFSLELFNSYVGLTLDANAAVHQAMEILRFHWMPASRPSPIFLHLFLAFEWHPVCRDIYR